MSYLYMAGDTRPTHGTHYGQVAGRRCTSCDYDEEAARAAMRGEPVMRKTVSKENVTLPKPVIKKQGHKLGVSVDGSFFESIAKACEATGLQPATLSKALRNGKARCKGHIIAYAFPTRITARERG